MHSPSASLYIYASVSQTSLLADPLWLQKITTDPHILVHINTECADDRYSKIKHYISEAILDSYEYISVAYVTMHCITGH